VLLQHFADVDDATGQDSGTQLSKGTIFGDENLRAFSSDISELIEVE
jgi:hypothetical protein